MTTATDDEMAPTRVRASDVLVAVARMEGKVDAALIGQGRIETKVDGLDIRVRALEAEQAALKAGAEADRQLHTQEATRQAQEVAARPSWPSVVSVGIAALLALFIVVEKYVEAGGT